jgi:hypothetical protein
MTHRALVSGASGSADTLVEPTGMSYEQGSAVPRSSSRDSPAAGTQRAATDRPESPVLRSSGYARTFAAGPIGGPAFMSREVSRANPAGT